MALRIDLRDNWTLRAVGGERVPTAVATAEIPARTPGCVHTDLLAADLIPDPYLDANENELSWIGRTDWRYSTAFTSDTLTGAERVDLVCEGLDTVADLVVNGHQVGSTRNMHRSYRFDITPVVRETNNTLDITFGSAYRYAEAVRDELGDRPCAYPEPFAFIRKMACNFGWDWGPTLVTAGIWRPLWLHAWSTARLAQVRPEITVTTGPDGRAHGQVVLHVDVERTDSGTATPLTLAVEVAGVRQEVTVAPGETAARVELTVPDPRLWWPRGYGEAALYPLALTLTAAGEELDTWQRDIGFRAVELDTRPDGDGARFALIVNGTPILVKGANWIPDDCFPHRVDRDRYSRRIDQAIDAGMNLLRIWGGGRYESEDFYELCDRRGVLVWQDFLFACAAYPEESPIAEEVEAEARDNVVRLAAYPSLVLWNGNNENIWGHADWGWREELGDLSWGEDYYLRMLPRVVAELDPTRPYWPGSPYSGHGEIHPNDERHGPMHIWDVWNERDYTRYLDYRPRFVAEFGFQAPPTYATLRRSVSDTPLRPDSPGMLHHQKAEDGNGKLARGLAHHFPTPADFDDWHYLTQVNQARAITLGIEHFRAQWPDCTGAVVWQLNDCWPVTSWAAVDGDARRKPLWYALRRVFRDRWLGLCRDTDGVVLVVSNDTDREWSGTVTLSRRGFDSDSGGPGTETTQEFRVEPRGMWRLPVPAAIAAAQRPESELITADTNSGERALWFFAEDIELAYPAPDFEAKVDTTALGGNDLKVTVTARSLLRDLSLFPDRLDPAVEADDMLVTLLPGESHTFTVRGGGGLDPEAVVAPPVLRCVNEAVRTARQAPHPAS
ncbi:glycoside hydrolase family 2 protein [Salinactinospora qingdaonensis]|uniref:beta-mannosidase n=1 Tax=Salinactinospora qingdaonensis TaxID=702744 RepID=A0ABP7FAC6_9ACTN